MIHKYFKILFILCIFSQIKISTWAYFFGPSMEKLEKAADEELLKKFDYLLVTFLDNNMISEKDKSFFNRIDAQGNLGNIVNIKLVKELFNLENDPLKGLSNKGKSGIKNIDEFVSFVNNQGNNTCIITDADGDVHLGNKQILNEFGIKKCKSFFKKYGNDEKNIAALINFYHFNFDFFKYQVEEFVQKYKRDENDKLETNLLTTLEKEKQLKAEKLKAEQMQKVSTGNRAAITNAIKQKIKQRGNRNKIMQGSKKIRKTKKPKRHIRHSHK